MIKIAMENVEKIIVPSFENIKAIIFNFSERLFFWPSLPIEGLRCPTEGG
jgi:hypothetical protein